MIDPIVLRARLVAIAGLHETQAAICAAQRQPAMAAACDNARIGVLEAIAVVDAMTTGRDLLGIEQPPPRPRHPDLPALYPQEVGTAP